MDYFDQQDPLVLLKQDVRELQEKLGAGDKGVPSARDRSDFDKFMNHYPEYKQDVDAEEKEELPKILDYTLNKNYKSFHPVAFDIVQQIEKQNMVTMVERGYFRNGSGKHLIPSYASSKAKPNKKLQAKLIRELTHGDRISYVNYRAHLDGKLNKR